MVTSLELCSTSGNGSMNGVWDEGGDRSNDACILFIIWNYTYGMKDGENVALAK